MKSLQLFKHFFFKKSQIKPHYEKQNLHCVLPPSLSCLSYVNDGKRLNNFNQVLHSDLLHSGGKILSSCSIKIGLWTEKKSWLHLGHYTCYRLPILTCHIQVMLNIENNILKAKSWHSFIAISLYLSIKLTLPVQETTADIWSYLAGNASNKQLFVRMGVSWRTACFSTLFAHSHEVF